MAVSVMKQLDLLEMILSSLPCFSSDNARVIFEIRNSVLGKQHTWMGLVTKV